MPDRKRAVVIGGSLGGLLAAGLLLRDGWDVHVHEKSPVPLDGRGAGIVTHPRLFEAMAELPGSPAPEDIGLYIGRRITFDRQGRILGQHEQGQTLTSWSHLYHLLKSAFPTERYHPGHACAGVSPRGDGVTVHWADGSSREAELVVAADGVRSTVRGCLVPGLAPAYAGYVAWRGLVEEQRLSPAWRGILMDHFSFGLPPGEQILGYPVAGPGNDLAVGRRGYNFVWYRPVTAAALEDMSTDDEGRHWREGIAPPLIREEWRERTRADAAEVLPPPFAEAVCRAEGLFFQPIVDLVSQRLVFGGVALLGDAAFVARPHCGMGVTKAADDALALRDALRTAGSLPAALAAYEGRQLASGLAVVERARALGGYMQAQGLPRTEPVAPDDAAAFDPGAFRSPEAVMRHTAVPPPWH